MVDGKPAFFSAEGVQWEAENYKELGFFAKSKNLLLVLSLLVPLLGGFFFSYAEGMNSAGYGFNETGLTNAQVDLVFWGGTFLVSVFFAIFMYLNHRWVFIFYGLTTAISLMFTDFSLNILTLWDVALSLVFLYFSYRALVVARKLKALDGIRKSTE